MFFFILHIEAVIALIAQLLLFYAILRHTPSRMLQIKPLLLKMAVRFFLDQEWIQFYEILGIIFGEGGLAPEDFFPLPVMKINGFISILGQEYGAYIAVGF